MFPYNSDNDYKGVSVISSTDPHFVLKFNRWSNESFASLRFWLSVVAVSRRECIILQDLWDQNNMPDPFKKLVASTGLAIDIRSTNYSACDNWRFYRAESENWRKAGAANITAYDLSKTDYFWLIDADDTIFLTDSYLVSQKLALAERIAKLSDLDGFSYAFYRHIGANHWSFGVALMRRDISMDLVASVEAREITQLNVADNLDGAFDVLRRCQKLKLESFILNDVIFHHHTAKIQNWNVGAPYGVYCWNKKILNGLVNFALLKTLLLLSHL
jgi:hypothetical protein